MSTDEIQFQEIDSIKYVCEMMPALLASATIVRLMALVGRPALVLAADAYTSFESGAIDDENGVANLIRLGTEQVFAGLTPEETETVLLSLLCGVKVAGIAGDLSDPVRFNAHFRGRLLSAYKVWAWSLQCNYRDFIDAARSFGIVEKLESAASHAMGNLADSTDTQISTVK